MAALHLFPFHVQLLACKLSVTMVIYYVVLYTYSPLVSRGFWLLFFECTGVVTSVATLLLFLHLITGVYYILSGCAIYTDSAIIFILWNTCISFPTSVGYRHSCYVYIHRYYGLTTKGHHYMYSLALQVKSQSSLQPRRARDMCVQYNIQEQLD